MIRALPPVVLGILSMLGLAFNTVFWCLLLLVPAVFKVLLPLDGVARVLNPWINGIASAWTSCNSWGMRAVTGVDWQAEGVDSLTYGDWYMVNCNHQTWVDIFVLQHVFNRRIPLLKFFLKQQLVYLPVIDQHKSYQCSCQIPLIVLFTVHRPEQNEWTICLV